MVTKTIKLKHKFRKRHNDPTEVLNPTHDNAAKVAML